MQPFAHVGSGDWDGALAQLWRLEGQIVEQAHTHGIKVIGCTLTPYGGAGYSREPGEAVRQAVNAFIRTGGARPERWGHTATLLADGRVLIAGGTAGVDPASNPELYDPATGAFTSVTPLLAPVSDALTATLLPNGNVLIAGGRAPSGSSSPRAELYDAATGSFTALGDMTTDRAFHTATLLPDGKVLIAGANNYNGGSSPGLASAEIYY